MIDDRDVDDEEDGDLDVDVYVDEDVDVSETDLDVKEEEVAVEMVIQVFHQLQYGTLDVHQDEVNSGRQNAEDDSDA